MGTINNTNVGPAGEIISSTAVNAKFTDVANATAAGSLAADNVRSEGVDRRTLAGSRAEPLAHMSYTNCTGSNNYTANTGESVFSITHGGGLSLTPNFTLKDGDLLRINFTIRLKSHNNNNYVPIVDQLVGAPQAPTLSIGLLFFPVWETASSGSFTVLPNQAAMDGTVVASAIIPFNDANLRTDSSAWCSMEGIESGATRVCRNTVHGAFYYKHTGADLLVDKVKLNGRGPVAYEWDVGTNQKVIRVPDWAAGPYSGNGWPTSWNFLIGVGQLSMMVLRGDS